MRQSFALSLLEISYAWKRCEHHSLAVTRREIFPSWVSSFPPQTFSLGISFVFGSVSGESSWMRCCNLSFAPAPD
jgi:hypothetical protein